MVTKTTQPMEPHEHRFDALRIRDDDGRIFTVCLVCGEHKYEQTRDEAIDLAWKRVRAFIADELECRESSMMPPSDADARYIESAKEALRAIDQIGIYMGQQGGQSNG